MWILCNLCAALNPDDLDALDQHAPLTKPTLDNLMGRTLTDVEYYSYLKQHPNAMWLFKEDYEALCITSIARLIPSIALFDKTLSDRLNNAINSGNDNSEPLEIGYTEEVVLTKLKRVRPDNIRNARRDFWQNHCLNMERRQSMQAKQDIWGDYVAWKNLQSSWNEYIQQDKQQVYFAPPSNNEDIQQSSQSSQSVNNEMYTFTYPSYYPKSDNYTSQYKYSLNTPQQQRQQYQYTNKNKACCAIF